MSSKNRSLLILVVLQAVLIVGFRLLPTNKNTPQARMDILPGFDPDKVTRIKISGAPKLKPEDPDQETIILSKSGATWGIEDADGFPADQTKVTEFLTKLKALRAGTAVLKSDTYHEKLEVAANKYSRKLELLQGDQTKILYFGTSPSFKTVHLRADGQNEVVLLSDFSTADMGSRAWNWVERNYVSVEEANLWSVQIKNKSGAIALERNPASNQWQAAGIDGALKDATLKELLGKARAINLESPVGKSMKPEFGFDNPLATISLVVGEPGENNSAPTSPETIEIQIGAKLEKQNQHYVKASNSEYVVRVAAWGLTPLLEKKTADLKP